MVKYNGYIHLYQDRINNETKLGTPFSNQEHAPKYVEYDCSMYKHIGIAKISLEIETDEILNFKTTLNYE